MKLISEPGLRQEHVVTDDVLIVSKMCLRDSNVCFNNDDVFMWSCLWFRSGNEGGGCQKDGDKGAEKESE